MLNNIVGKIKGVINKNNDKNESQSLPNNENDQGINAPKLKDLVRNFSGKMIEKGQEYYKSSKLSQNKKLSVNSENNENQQNDSTSKLNESKETSDSFPNKSNNFKKIIQTYGGKIIQKGQQYKDKFVEKAITGVKLPGEDRICALISAMTYKDKYVRDLEVYGYTNVQEYNLPTSCLYINHEKKRCIIGYRGTVITELRDLLSDTQILLDIQGIDTRIMESLSAYDTIKRDFEGYNLRVTGHSLGGTLAYVVGKHRCPDRCVVFNPGVSLNTTYLQMQQDNLRGIKWTKNTYTYKVFGDLISALARIGTTKSFTIESTNPLTLHSILSFLDTNTINRSFKDLLGKTDNIEVASPYDENISSDQDPISESSEIKQ